MKKFIISAFAALAMVASAQTQVSPYRPGLTENGITYFLPKTCLHLTVVAKRTTHVPGEFCKYAERFLRLKEVTMAKYDTWEITGITITPFGVADQSKAYTIKMNAKTSAPLVGLAPDGRLLSVNAQPYKLPELSVPSIGASETSKMGAADFKTEEILLAGSTVKMAELAAEEIFDIRENRGLLAKGQADFMPKDGEQLKLMLASLDQQEKGLLQLFKGYTTTEERTYTFDFMPQGAVENALLFRFSKHLGIVDIDDLAGAPVTMTVKDLKSLPAEVQVDKKKKKKVVEDLRYVLPGRAEVSLFWDGRSLTSLEVPMSQLGRIEHLGGDLFNKKYGVSVRLSPENGGIVKIDMAQPQK